MNEKYQHLKSKDQSKQMCWIIGGSILFILLMYIIRNIFKETFDKPSLLDNYLKKSRFDPKTKESNESKGEAHARKLALQIFQKPFIKTRPDFLRNNVTGKNLELDIYNEELKLAIETDGEQHAKYIPFFHKNYEHFLTQKYRDEIKNMLCKQNNINLIRVPHTVPLEEYENYIRVEAKKLGYSV
jgi:hypothetical protein